MSSADYVAGLGWIAVVVWAHARTSTRLQVLLVPRLSWAGARLAACVLFLMSVITLGQLLGALNRPGIRGGS